MKLSFWTYLIGLLLILPGCGDDDNPNPNYLPVRYEVEDIRGGVINADLLKYRDETGITESKYNLNTGNSLWSYEAQFKKGKKYLLYYEEYVEPSKNRQEYRLTVLIDGKVVHNKYITINPGATKSKELTGTVEDP